MRDMLQTLIYNIRLRYYFWQNRDKGWQYLVNKEFGDLEKKYK